MSDVVDSLCISCGEPLRLTYCERCGEKRVSTHDYSIVHFAEHIVETLWHFDIRSLKAVWLLVAKPGLLTRDYLAGRRKAFVGPIQLFVILNVVFALTGANTFKTPLVVQQQSWFPELKSRMVATAKAHKQIDDQEFEREFDRTATTQAKTWIFTMIPAWALVLAVLYGFRRYFFEHLVFATHYMAFVLVWILIIGIPANYLFYLMGVNGGSRDQLVSLILLLGLLVYVGIALTRVYGDRWYWASARSLVMFVAFLPVLRAYRFLLFFVTLKTMH